MFNKESIMLIKVALQNEIKYIQYKMEMCKDKSITDYMNWKNLYNKYSNILSIYDDQA